MELLREGHVRQSAMMTSSGVSPKVRHSSSWIPSILCTLSCSPFQDDFSLSLHVQDDFDSVSLYCVTASDILVNKKERKRLSINRNFVGDYLGFADNPSFRALVGEW